jgi:MFS family permease
MDESTSPVVLGLWLLVMSLGSGLSLAAVQSAAVESAPRRYSGMATGVFSTTANLGGIIGITLTSVALGDAAGLDAFRTIFILYLATSLLGALITTRVEPWPTNDEDAQEGRFRTA